MVRLMMALTAALLVACSSSKKMAHDPEKANEVLISFITKAQAGFWDDAMAHITYAERTQMMDGGLVKPEYQMSINRLRLSVVAKMPFFLDDKGRLVGIKEMLDNSNKRYVTSDEQRSVNLEDVDKARSERINRRREEGQRVMEEQNRQREDSPDVIYTNRLSENERQRALQGDPTPSATDEFSADDWQENTSAPADADASGTDSAQPQDNAGNTSSDAAESATDAGDEWR